MNWYNKWFGTHYYDLLYNQRDEVEAKAFLDLLVNYLRPTTDKRFLDLGCGKGRHSVYLNSLGFDVTGIDLSEINIEYCKKFENDHLNFCIEKMIEADGIIIGSPVYFADVTTEVKALIDVAGYVTRSNNHLLKRKVGAGVIAVRRGGALHAFETINNFFLMGNAAVLTFIFFPETYTNSYAQSYVFASREGAKFRLFIARVHFFEWEGVMGHSQLIN